LTLGLVTQTAVTSHTNSGSTFGGAAARTVENVSALVAYGVGLDGHRLLLAVTIGSEESRDCWSELLTQLSERGLSGVVCPENTEVTALTGVSRSAGWRRRLALGTARRGSFLSS